MQKESNRKLDMRSKLLRLCVARGMSNGMILQTILPMKGKSSTEKEQIAAQILEKMQTE